MRQPTFCGRELLPLSVIEAARAGDPLAVERVLRYYEGYIDKLCTRTLYDLDGSPHVRVDEYMKTRLQSRGVLFQWLFGIDQYRFAVGNCNHWYRCVYEVPADFCRVARRPSVHWR